MARKLASVPAETPPAETPTDDSAAKTYTFGDLYADNVALIESVTGQALTPEAAVNLFAVTLNYQLTKLQLGLTQALPEN